MSGADRGWGGAAGAGPDWGPPAAALPAPARRPVAGDHPAPAKDRAAGGRPAAAPAPPPASRLAAGEWHRLHPLSPLVRAGRGLIALLVALVLTLGSQAGHDDIIGDLAVIGLVLLLGIVSWLVTRWRVEESALRIDTGLVRRSSRRFPLGQVQAVDIVEPALARVFGLAEIRVRVAGSSGSAGRLSYLPLAEAQRLRARLLALAHGLAENVPPPPERVLVTVDTRRLAFSLLISGPGVVLEAILVALAVLGAVSPSLATVAISAGVTSLLALATAVWRRLNSGYGLQVAEAADGLRLRSGLLQTTAETIPFGRVQAVRVVEPLVWRPFGWCRVDVDVAGKQKGGGDSRAESRTVRSLLPVGTGEQARVLLDRLVAAAPSRLTPPPPRARWKSPLRFPHLSWGANDAFAVATSGRLRRVTAWVPLSKVQSVRLVEGPMQRAFRLGTVHLDTAGRNVHAALRDRSLEECAVVMHDLPERCRRARRRPGAPR